MDAKKFYLGRELYYADANKAIPQVVNHAIVGLKYGGQGEIRLDIVSIDDTRRTDENTYTISPDGKYIHSRYGYHYYFDKKDATIRLKEELVEQSNKLQERITSLHTKINVIQDQIDKLE